MLTLKKLLAGKVLLILLFAGGLAYVDTITDLKLGLDLKGGTQLDYSLDLSQVAEEDQTQIIEGVQEVIRKRVDSLGVSEPNIYVSNLADEYHVIVELAGISDIEEAKNTVGKTIQLEFKEASTEANPDRVGEATEQATTFYNAILNGGDFETLSLADFETYGSDVRYELKELQSLDNFSPPLREAIEGKAVGSILAPFELNEGYIVDQGGLRASEGIAVIEITDRTTEEVETIIPGEVSSRHILISYKGAERSEAERSKKEAASLADELLARIQGGEALADLAGEFSNDLGSGANGGDLGSFGRGVMTEDFENTAFDLEVGAVSEIVETEFGFHIIETYEKTVEEVSVETVEKVAFKQSIYSTLANPWAEEAVLTGEHFKHADVAYSQTYEPYVSITFTKEGGDLFEELTERNIGQPIAIFVGGDLISAPNVNQVIAGGQAQITGSFTLEEAQELARDLNTGAIPAPIELVGQYTISATLGAQALNESLFAGILGLAILGLFMLLYYRLPGLIADIALTIYSIILIFFIKIALPTAVALTIGVLIFGYLVHVILKNKDSGGEKLVSFLLACVVLFFMIFVLSSPITLTLAGIAGVILSIGMAVDANVLIFERMKEELAEDKPLDEAIRDGFDRAWDSIRDSNFSSLITCAILFYFGSSIIRGFALNLALGILVSMFSAITLTYGFLKFTASTKLGENMWLYGKPRGDVSNRFQIVKSSKIWASISGVLLTISIISIAIFGLNFGIDFTGGTLMEVQIEQEITTEMLEESIMSVEDELEADFGSPSIVTTGEGSFVIRMKHLSEEDHDGLLAAFSEYGEVEEIRFTTVGPTIGSALKKKAVTALIITLVMIVFYIAFAFRKIPKEVSPWRFGFAAIAALVHDILIVVGVFVLLGHFMDVELDALFITALLTIMGFSVHDTIVVFDRVRENLRYRKSGESLADTTNKALNQTMARSINTSLSTLITIVALLIFGAESIKMFVLALAIGIVAGTYSSIFVASPLLVWWNERSNK